MRRYNSFNLTHKALRGMMYDTALTLQQTYFADLQEATDVLQKIEIVINEFEHHAHYEDTFILPAIEMFAPGLVEAFEKEHVADLIIGNRLKNLASIYYSLNTDEERINCGSAINKAFRDFMVFNIEHMAKEEIEINRVLWAKYTDEELLDLNQRLTAGVPLNQKMLIAKWMLRSVNKAEAIAWLQAVKETGPSFVFDALIDLVETELPALTRSAVLEAVLEEELLF